MLLETREREREKKKMEKEEPKWVRENLNILDSNQILVGPILGQFLAGPKKYPSPT